MNRNETLGRSRKIKMEELNMFAKKCRILCSIMCLIMVWSLVGCQNQGIDHKEREKKTLKIASLKGPTSMGLVSLMKESEEQKNTKYDFSMYTTADEIVPLMVKGEIDIAAIPANLASVLYHKTNGEVSVLNINTLGVLYILENKTTIHSFADLKGRKVYMTGKGTIPEYVMRYLMKENGLEEEDIVLEFKSEPLEIANILSTESDAIAVMPQPFVSVAMKQNESLRIALDLTEEWERVNTSNSSCITGVTIVRNDVLKENQEMVAAFLSDQEKSVQDTNANVANAAVLMEEYDIVKENVAKEAIPYCNLTYISGAEMKEQLGGYLLVLYELNKESVGGSLPEDAFYYEP